MRHLPWDPVYNLVGLGLRRTVSPPDLEFPVESLLWSGAARGLPGCLSYTSSPPRGPTAGVVSRNPEYHIPSFDTIRVTSCSLPVSPGSFSRAILINWKSRKPTAEVPGFKFPARALAGTGNTPRTYSGHEILLCFLLNFLFVCF